MHKNYLVLLALVLATLLPSCNMPAPMACTAAELVAAEQTSPANWAVVSSLTPNLTWDSDSPGGGPYPYDDCFPQGYHVRLRQGPYFTSGIDGTTYGAGNREWSPTSPLAPGTEYSWGVSAYGVGGDGPYAGERYFFTGPVCGTGALVAPNLEEPNNGSIVTTLSPTLIWDYPNPCVPEGYRIDLSTESAFVDTSLSGGTGNPSTRWGPGSDLTNCTTYYWRVAPINGTTLGPFSITRNFFVNTGSCLYPLPPLVIEPLVTIPPGFPLPDLDLISNANCRIGPSQLYGIRTAYLAGQKIPIDGRNEAGTWLHTGPDDCYISIVLGNFNGDLNLLPVLIPPPEPTVAPDPTKKPTRVPPNYSSCSDYTTKDLCTQDPGGIGGCYWSNNNSCNQLK